MDHERMMQEEWMPVDDFPGYSVSNYGYVLNEKTGRQLMNSPVQYGMLTVALFAEGQMYRRSVATIVARAFCPPPPRSDFNTPIHLDGDRQNCRSDNLAWRPRWFAINYHLERRRRRNSRFRQDIRIMETGEVFDDLSTPAMKYGLLENDILRSLNEGIRVFPIGYTFIYLH